MNSTTASLTTSPFLKASSPLHSHRVCSRSKRDNVRTFFFFFRGKKIIQMSQQSRLCLVSLKSLQLGLVMYCQIDRRRNNATVKEVNFLAIFSRDVHKSACTRYVIRQIGSIFPSLLAKKLPLLHRNIGL